MGFKRPYDEEELQELPLKYPKQVEYGNKMTLFAEIYPRYEPTQKADIPGESGEIICKFQLGDEFEHDSKKVVSDLADKDFELSSPLSRVTSSTRKEDAGSGTTICSSLSPEFYEFYFPRRSIVQFEDTYSSLLNSSPKIQVPIGPNHQAEVPVWDPQVIDKYDSGSDHFADACGGKLMGDCILLMPDPELSAHSSVKAGDGRKDCFCPDQGSGRCVEQHVREARERVRETLGHEKFVQLGFCEMGEEVSQNWTEEEERIFYEVVYSNPASCGGKFWEHLSMVFPSRAKKEIVSYYFNVFVLRRRAFQNRSNFLDIDSDDDEWQGRDEGLFGITREDEDSAIDSMVEQDVHMDHQDDSPDDNDDADSNNDEYDEDDDKGDSDGCDGDDGNGGGNTYIVDSFGSADRRANVRERGVKSDSKEGLHGNDGGFGSGHFFEPCDAKFWNARYPMSPLKGFDLLPTGNIIEEIFGSCTPNNKSE